MVMAGAKAVGGIAQLIAGKRILKKNKMPGYDIPDEYSQSVRLAEGIKNLGMPQTEYGQAIQNINRNITSGIGALQNRRSAVAGIGTLVQRANDATLNLDTQAARIRNQNIVTGTNMQRQSLYNLGLQKLAKQRWEKQDPYLRKMQEGQALVGAGLQNVFGAATSAATADMYKQMYGTNKGDDYSAYEFDSNKLNPAIVRRNG